MKQIITIITFLICSFNPLCSQENELIRTLPSEGVYVHTNTALAFAGEYFYYQFYTFLNGKGSLSPISKIGYVDLVNEEAKVIFHHKLKLSNGNSASEYFIPADMPSGNYKLIGYTQWMRNAQPSTFFQMDVTIINPYLGDQSVFLKQNSYSEENKAPTAEKESDNNRYLLALNKKELGKREMGKITLSSKLKSDLAGIFSLSVRKKEELPIATKPTIQTILRQNKQESKLNSYAFLPESRGDFITGKLISDNNTEQHKVIISFPGENNVLKIATTDKEGYFQTQLHEDYSETSMLITPLKDDDEFQILLKTDSVLDFGKLTFHQFQLKESMREIILERSIQNQIENAYFHLRPDSIIAQQVNVPFYDGEIKHYLLDDYTRFPTIRETAVEILEHVWIEETNKDEINFKIRPFLPLQDTGERPLILLDGAYIEDHGKLLNLPAKSIKSISIGREQYLYGSYSFQGIIEIKTLEGNSYSNYLSNSTQSYSYSPPRIQKQYYKENYNGKKRDIKNYIPDFRRQLLWMPKITSNKNLFQTEFFTSDVDGEFEIVLEGITANGTPIVASASFKVK